MKVSISPSGWLAIAVAEMLSWVAIAVVLYSLRRRRQRGPLSSPPSERSVTVVVLGDIGRSPRMQYHSLCLARHFGHVDLVGSAGEPPSSSVLADPRITIHALPQFPRMPALPAGARGLFFVFAYAPAKVATQALRLMVALAYTARPASHILVQNPPSLPTLAVVWAAARLGGARMVCDWHNLGHTLLAMSAGGAGRHLVRLAAAFERLFGARLADAHLTVTAAMAAHVREWGPVPPSVPIAVLRDRPHAGTFRPLPPVEAGAFLHSFAAQRLTSATAPASEREILSRVVSEAGKELSRRRVAVLVSSTSWTPDEDFGVLLDALAAFETTSSRAEPGCRDILVVITGKGPERDAYLARIAAMDLRRVAVVSAWFSNEDYPKMLASADLGVSLHQSSSQLDLPMKVLDMFGSGLPVLARWYPCLAAELVQDGATGKTFRDSEELAAGIHELIGNPDGTPKLKAMRQFVLAKLSEMGSWEDEWEHRGLPLFT